MNKRKHNTLILIFIGTAALIILSAIGLVNAAMNSGNLKALFVFLVLLFCCLLALEYVILFIHPIALQGSKRTSSKKKKGDLQSNVITSKKEKTDVLQSNKKVFENVKTADLPEYTGFNTFHIKKIGTGIFFAAIFVFYNCLFLSMALYEDVEINILQFLVVSTVITVAFLKYCNRRMTINEQGVTVKNIFGQTKFHIPWDKIDTVGISAVPKTPLSGAGFLYFSKRSSKNPPSIPKYTESNMRLMIVPRPQVVHCILQYWDKDIDNIKELKNWQKYVRKQKDLQ